MSHSLLICLEFISQERVLKKGLNVNTISDALLREYQSFAQISSNTYPPLRISGRYFYHISTCLPSLMKNLFSIRCQMSVSWNVIFQFSNIRCRILDVVGLFLI